eukprot:2001638-Prymnesium_polylepis.2
MMPLIQSPIALVRRTEERADVLITVGPPASKMESRPLVDSRPTLELIRRIAMKLLRRRAAGSEAAAGFGSLSGAKRWTGLCSSAVRKALESTLPPSRRQRHQSRFHSAIRGRLHASAETPVVPTRR